MDTLNELNLHLALCKRQLSWMCCMTAAQHRESAAMQKSMTVAEFDKVHELVCCYAGMQPPSPPPPQPGPGPGPGPAPIQPVPPPSPPDVMGTCGKKLLAVLCSTTSVIIINATANALDRWLEDNKTADPQLRAILGALVASLRVILAACTEQRMTLQIIAFVCTLWRGKAKLEAKLGPVASALLVPLFGMLASAALDECCVNVPSDASLATLLGI